jgi:hypothetical protein
MSNPVTHTQINLQIQTSGDPIAGTFADHAGTGRPFSAGWSWSPRSKTHAPHPPPIPCPGSAPKDFGGHVRSRCASRSVGGVRGTLLLILVMGATAASAHGASSLPPCAAGAVISPTVNFTDTAKGTTRLTATHPIQAAWSAFNSDGKLLLYNYSVSPPFAMLPDGESASFVPAHAGTYTFGLGWDQQQIQGSANACSSSLSRAITVAPATRPRFSPVHFSFGGRLAERITELSWTLNTSGPRLNLGLVTADLRAVARDQLPTSRTPAHTLRFPLCDCDPLFGKVHNPSVVRIGPVQLVPNTEFGIRFLIDINVSTTHVTRFGYDLLVRQGNQRLGRLRADGICRFAAGFSNCKVGHYPKPEK